MYTYAHIHIYTYIYIYIYVDTHPHTHTRLLGTWLPSKGPGFTATSLCPARISQISVLMSENSGITGLSRRDLARAYYGPSVYETRSRQAAQSKVSPKIYRVPSPQQSNSQL